MVVTSSVILKLWVVHFVTGRCSVCEIFTVWSSGGLGFQGQDCASVDSQRVSTQFAIVPVSVFVCTLCVHVTRLCVCGFLVCESTQFAIVYVCVCVYI